MDSPAEESRENAENGETARQLVETSRGALERALSEISRQLGGAPR